MGNALGRDDGAAAREANAEEEMLALAIARGEPLEALQAICKQMPARKARAGTHARVPLLNLALRNNAPLPIFTWLLETRKEDCNYMQTDLCNIGSHECCALKYALALGNAPCVHALLEHGADPNLRCQNSAQSILVCALFSPAFTARGGLETILSSKVPINLELHGARFGRSVMHEAVAKRISLEKMKLILARFTPKELNLVLCDQHGNTALHEAAGMQDADEMVQILLKHGASPMVRNRFAQRPIDFAISYKTLTRLSNAHLQLILLAMLSENTLRKPSSSSCWKRLPVELTRLVASMLAMDLHHSDFG